MIDGPTASVIVSALLGTFGMIIVAMIKFVPQRGDATAEPCDDDRRLSDLQTRVAVVESNFGNLGRSFDDLRREIHEMRAEVKALMTSGRMRSHTGEP
jgi:hypothetical protein